MNTVRKTLAREAKIAVDAGTKGAINIIDAYQRFEGLKRADLTIARFVDFFPYNIILVFAFFTTTLGLLNFIIYHTLEATTRSHESIEAERLQALSALEKARADGDHDRVAEQTLTLETLKAEAEYPAETKNSIMTIASLVIGIGGIFSLPLITSATLKMQLRRIRRAEAAVASRSPPGFAK